ncbi:MAG: trypsin-like peptidase domain-containing protein, partial [Planctomycetales bacterium]|nr:trypsin-like peptidase domain-containing protein [Planctomycetales bacterium]
MTQTQSKSTQLGPLALTSLLGLSLCFPSAFVLADETSSVRRTNTVRAIQTAEPAVVNIEGNKPSNPAMADSQQVNGMGAGVIIDARGYILTNQHVVQDVGRIEITLHDGTRHIGRLIARDADTDLALVKINSKTPLPVIRCGTSSDLMRGERVIAIGNPFGYHNTVTEGIVSALHRDIPVNGTQNYPDLIQTDASINPGNSGGPLLNADGEMIGINAAVRIGAQGIGFAIPVDKATEIAADMIAQHRRGSFESSVSVSTKYSEGAAYVEVVRASGS